MNMSGKIANYNNKATPRLWTQELFSFQNIHGFVAISSFTIPGSQRGYMFNDCNILSTEDRTTDQYFPDKARRQKPQ